jgi:hypothetical protein
MQEPPGHVIVPSPQRTELQQFAQWFHQDWNLVFPEFYSGAAMYFKQLPPERRMELQRQLRAFLDANAGAGPRKLKNLWLKLGAQAWQNDLDIRAVLEDFCWMATDEKILEKKPTR